VLKTLRFEVRAYDNRYEIARLIRCGADEPRVIGEANVFEVQERLLDRILQALRSRQAVAAAPRILNPSQARGTRRESAGPDTRGFAPSVLGVCVVVKA
jgi:hypothetical protein